MNDRYLFKAKSVSEGVWYTGFLMHVFDKNCCILDSKNGNGYVCKTDTICQCTGLKDKAGNLIWENDVVRYFDYTEKRYAIVWEEDKACFEYQRCGCSMMNFDESSAFEVEIVGSIIDNPELLEVE